MFVKDTQGTWYDVDKKVLKGKVIDATKVQEALRAERAEKRKKIAALIAGLDREDVRILREYLFRYGWRRRSIDRFQRPIIIRKDYCPPDPGYCPPDPGYCPPDPGYCPPDPGYCPPDPGYCPPDPGYCPPDPGYCPPDPGYCPPDPGYYSPDPKKKKKG